MLNGIEKGCFVSLFNRGGYVLDFSTADFDSFTMQNCGTPLCTHYGLSKGKSLITFTNEADDSSVQKLLFALLEHYEIYFQHEFNRDYENSSAYEKKYNPEMASLYNRCREYRDREFAKESPFDSQIEYIKSKFTSEYMYEQIDLLLQMRTKNPTEAIGKSKELVESCCKTILEHYGVQPDKTWDVGRLSKETAKVLEIDANQFSGVDDESRIVKKILGSLQGLVGGLSEFRNSYGSGHGKGDNFAPLPVRHAKLAAGCAITIVEYYWETFEWRQAMASYLD